MKIKTSFTETYIRKAIRGVYKEEVMEELHTYNYIYAEFINEKNERKLDTPERSVALLEVIEDKKEESRIKTSIFK